jgi:hypothetical protein
MKVKFEGGIKDVPLSQVTAANYIVPKGEERSWHVIQEKKEFDRNTGKQLSRPMLQKYDTKCYPQTRKYLMDAGYTITVLHDPIKWAQANKLALEAAEAKCKEAAQKAAAEKEAAERAALKAELIAEIKAEMEAEKKAKKTSSK